MNFTSWLPESLQSNAWILQACVTIVVALFLHIAYRMIYRRLQPKLRASHSLWDDAFLDALSRPFILLVWAMAISYEVEAVRPLFEESRIFPVNGTLRPALIAVFIAWFLMRFINSLEKRLSIPGNTKTKMDATSIRAISILSKVIILLLAALIILQILGIPVSGVMAFGGASGIIVGLAAQDLLANFFGGFMILTDRPFKVGDWIRSPEKNIEGVVEYIGWRLTRIRTFDKRPLFVPNAVFSKIAVENPSRMFNRRIKAIIGIRYEDASKLEGILNEVREMLKKHPEIDTNQWLMVNFTEFGPSALNFMVYTFTKKTKWDVFQSIQQDVLLKIMQIIIKNGAQIAYPTTTVHVADGLQPS